MEKEYHAKLVVHNLPGLKKKQIKALVTWLRKQADEFEEEEPEVFAKTFTARLMK